MEACIDQTDFVKALEQQVTPLRKYAIWLTKDPEDANDLTQETFIAAYQNHHRYVFNGSLSAWLRRILFNKYVNHFKRSKRLVSLDTVDQQSAAYTRKEMDPLGTLIGDEILETIQGLDQRYRDAISLRIRGFKYHEIAERLDVPEGTVKNRIFHARQQLQNRLST